MKKRIFSFLLACIFVIAGAVAALPVNAADAETWTLKKDFDATFTDGPFALKGYNVTKGEFIDLTWSNTALSWNGQLVDKWQAVIPVFDASGTQDTTDAFAFKLKDDAANLVIMPHKAYDSEGAQTFFASAIVFTAPADGVYTFNWDLTQHWGDGENDRKQQYYVVVGDEVIDEEFCSTSKTAINLAGIVELKKDETVVFFHRLAEDASSSASLGADVNNLTVYAGTPADTDEGGDDETEAPDDGNDGTTAKPDDDDKTTTTDNKNEGEKTEDNSDAVIIIVTAVAAAIIVAVVVIVLIKRRK